ncbi:hypothetical protein SDC9_89623 [bioreactor metagenome]|uniref:CDP-Glycerol:Poly(Glycerophosphate) glycerophosphotransferase n=1 Tax=bioreactor metagenome TaxID=1076179 RepID=A0A644ZST0_9ZZZZ
MEVVVFPYKASMWDSLESVWLAAQDDPQCDAYVVPIPYFDRLPDGSLGQMHDEGDLYPDYVPVVNWRAYDTRARHPDVVFIHYPYDHANHVTSVHPDYYSDRLKGLTDLLAYVPYFVAMEELQEEFCLCPGVFNADKVFVQSEKIRRAYIQALKKYQGAPRGAAEREHLESKYEALGSPKFDKIVNAKEASFQFPDAWKRLLYRPDGSRKRVVLYNTTVTGLLRGNGSVLRKLRYVFDSFAAQDDFLLLWRPHPFNLTAYQTMRPQLLHDYLGIIDDYKSKGFGIYDDSPDLDRAIAVADAYYGDGSSLVALFQCAGKPVILQDSDYAPGPSDPAREPPFRFENLFDGGDCFWFTSAENNALFQMDKSSGAVRYKGSFPNEKVDAWLQYGAIAKCNGRLYFSPRSAEALGEYDIEKKTFRRIPFPPPSVRSQVRYNPACSFNAVASHGAYVFFIGASYPAIVRYDTATQETRYFSDWVAPVDKLINNTEYNYFARMSVTHDSRHIIAACSNANAVVVLDMETGASVVHEVGTRRCQYSSIAYDGENYWLAPILDGPIVKWNMNSGEFWELDAFPKEFDRGIAGWASFFAIRCVERALWLFPCTANMVLKIDPDSHAIAEAKAFADVCRGPVPDLASPTSRFFSVSDADGVIHAFNFRTNRLISYDAARDALSGQAVQPPAEFKKLRIFTDAARYLQRPDSSDVRDCYFYEPQKHTLNELFGSLFSEQCKPMLELCLARQGLLFENIAAHTDGTAGRHIWKSAKDSVLKY